MSHWCVCVLLLLWLCADGYTPAGRTGFPITAADELDFLTFLSNQARAQGLGIGLKNTLGLITTANMPLWDFAVNEQCYEYTECDAYIPFQQGVKCLGLPGCLFFQGQESTLTSSPVCSGCKPARSLYSSLYSSLYRHNSNS